MAARRFFSVVRWVLTAQLTTVSLAGMAAWLAEGMGGARSALLGGMVAFLPNLYFAFRFGIRDPRKTTRQVIRAFYAGEAVKLFITAGLFVLVFQLPDIRFVPLFVSFGLAVGVAWFALLVRGTEW